MVRTRTFSIPETASVMAAMASGLLLSMPMTQEVSSKYFITTLMPSTMLSVLSSIRRISQVMKGSHSAPLITRVSTSARFLGFSLMWVGNPAPPRPTRPQARTALIRSSRLFTTGGARSGQGVWSLSVVMTTLLHLSPPGVINSSMAVTVPETLEWIGADRNASVSPSSCPTVTVSFTFTRGSQGAPMCWIMGITTLSGTGILTAALLAVFLQCLTLTPFNALLNNDGTCTSLQISSRWRRPE